LPVVVAARIIMPVAAALAVYYQEIVFLSLLDQM
jgi:hypothetical protein